jgi:hypothetical protein
LKALSAVNSSLESSFGIQKHLNKISEQEDMLDWENSVVELELFQSRMKGHERALLRLLEVSSGTSNLV